MCAAGSCVLLDAVAVGALPGCVAGAAPAVGDRFAGAAAAPPAADADLVVGDTGFACVPVPPTFARDAVVVPGAGDEALSDDDPLAVFPAGTVLCAALATAVLAVAFFAVDFEPVAVESREALRVFPVSGFAGPAGSGAERSAVTASLCRVRGGPCTSVS